MQSKQMYLYRSNLAVMAEVLQNSPNRVLLYGQNSKKIIDAFNLTTSKIIKDNDE